MTDLPVILRAADGPDTGVGHLTRCRALACELQSQGIPYLLWTDTPAGAEWLTQRGVEAQPAEERLLPARSVWLDGFRDWSGELQWCQEQGVPSYLVENRIADRDRATGVIYPALHWIADEWDRAHPESCWGGRDWTPLAPELLAMERVERDVDLLVTFGGSDPGRLTLRTVASLERLGWEGRAAIVLGPHMQKMAGEIPSSGGGRTFEVVDGRGGISDWMVRSRLAITALGTTLIELAWFDVPGLILANYSGDREAMQWYERHGLHRGLGIAGELDEARLDAELQAALRESWYAPRLRVSSKGTQRIVDQITGKAVHV